VWRADLDAVDGAWALAALAPAERARAQALGDPLRRRRWIAARGVLRAILGRYSGLPPRSVRIRGGEGKPVVPARMPAFNVSHSAGTALYALAAGGEVGVDVETLRPRARAVELAGRVFGEDFAAHLRALDPAERDRAFLVQWTRREAALKCAGAGLGAADGVVEPAFQAELDAGAGLVAAVAASFVPDHVRARAWLCDVQRAMAGRALTAELSEEP
jgi:4'-phosphopantetheinyl transferase